MVHESRHQIEDLALAQGAAGADPLRGLQAEAAPEDGEAAEQEPGIIDQ